MNNSIFFRNEGLIELAAVTTMGISVKEGDSAIGQFGTGLKYAIAIILRLGGCISIYRGKEQFVFDKITTQVRGEDFDIITMNGVELGFTTHYGFQWKMWMAFREIYSNMLDEKGEVFLEDLPELTDDSTIIEVSYSPEFMDCYRNRSDYFITTKPLHVNSFADIHPGASNHVYYRGIRAHELEKTSKFTYNIQTKMDLTEDRTIQHSHWLKDHAARSIFGIEDPSLLRKLIVNVDDSFESIFPYKMWISETETNFIDFMKNLKKQSQLHNATKNARDAYFEMTKTNDKYSDWTLDEIEKDILEEALIICEALKFSTIRNSEIVFKENLGTGVLGKAEEGIIYLSKAAFIDGGATKVAGTLIEEHAHITQGYSDCSRALQNWLVDQLAWAGVRAVKKEALL